MPLLFVILEISFFPNINFLNLNPNLFLMLLIALSFVVSEKELIYIAFFGSILLDIFSPTYFGSQALIIVTIMFFILLALYFIFSTVNFFLLILLALFGTFLYDLLNIVFIYLSGFTVDVIYYFKNIFILKLFVNIAVLLLVYPLVDFVWEKILKTEGRIKLIR